MAIESIREVAPVRASGMASIAFFSAGFRPFFLLAGIWAAAAVPIWLAAYVHGYAVGGALPAMIWHAHEMVYGYGMAAVTGFLLTAVPNWTGRLPLRGTALALLGALWLAGRVALLASGWIGAAAAAAIDLAFPAVLVPVIAREVTAAKSFHNLPVVAILGALFCGNLLVHLHALDVAYTGALGNRIGVATLLLLIALIGGRIVPSFTRNWLAKHRPEGRMPAPHSALDWICLALAAIGLVAWAAAPGAAATPALELAAGLALAVRLARWRGLATLREPLLFVLHAGYAWLAAGLALNGLNGFLGWLPPGAPLHALTIGAIGTMTLAVMTRASLGHGGRPLAAGAGTTAAYALVTLAAVLRVAASLAGALTVVVIAAAGLAWSAAFALFVILYAPILIRRRT